MSITILFVLAPIGAIVAWWLSRQRLMAKPWLEVGAIDDFPGTGDIVLACRDHGRPLQKPTTHESLKN